MGEDPGMSEAVRDALLDGKAVSFRLYGSRAERDEVKDQWIAGLEGFFQALHVVGLPIIKTVKGADIFDHFFLGDFLSRFVGDANRLDES